MGLNAEVIDFDFNSQGEPFCPVDLIKVTARVGSRCISLLHEINFIALVQ